MRRWVANPTNHVCICVHVQVQHVHVHVYVHVHTCIYVCSDVLNVHVYICNTNHKEVHV